MNSDILFLLGLFLFLAGFLLTFLAVALLAFRHTGEGRVRGGGVILLGPIPIVFGDVKYSRFLIVLAVVLFLLFLLIALVPSGVPGS